MFRSPYSIHIQQRYGQWRRWILCYRFIFRNQIWHCIFYIYIRQTKSYIDFQILVTEQLLRTKLHEMNVIHIGIGQQILK